MITIESSVLNASGGDLELLAGDHLRVQPGTAISTAAGNILLAAGTRPPGSTVTSSGSLTLQPRHTGCLPARQYR
jgi:hypothetical protein